MLGKQRSFGSKYLLIIGKHHNLLIFGNKVKINHNEKLNLEVNKILFTPYIYIKKSIAMLIIVWKNSFCCPLSSQIFSAVQEIINIKLLQITTFSFILFTLFIFLLLGNKIIQVKDLCVNTKNM